MTSSEQEKETFGPNEWMVDELFQQYQEDKQRVDPAWWEFFADYQPSKYPEIREEALATPGKIIDPVTGASTSAPIAAAPAAPDALQPPPSPVPADIAQPEPAGPPRSEPPAPQPTEPPPLSQPKVIPTLPTAATMSIPKVAAPPSASRLRI